MGMKEEIKELAGRLGMSMCGVSGVDRFATSPEGKHPCEVLPGCKSVIAVGVRLLDGTIQANFRAFEDGREDLKGLYGTYGYAMLPNFELSYVCYSIAKYVEEKTDEAAAPCSTGPMTNGAQISLRHAAVAAGLGEFGWLGIVLTPRYGPRNRFGVVLTTLELEPDPMYDGKPLCNPEKCGICAEACPSGALSRYTDGNPKRVEMGGKVSEYCQLDWAKCFMVEEAMKKKYGGREDYLTTDEPTMKDIFEASARMPHSDSGLQRIESWHCGKCLSYCPTGDWAKRFSGRGLSRGAAAAAGAGR